MNSPSCGQVSQHHRSAAQVQRLVANASTCRSQPAFHQPTATTLQQNQIIQPYIHTVSTELSSPNNQIGLISSHPQQSYKHLPHLPQILPQINQNWGAQVYNAPSYHQNQTRAKFQQEQFKISNMHSHAVPIIHQPQHQLQITSSHHSSLINQFPSQPHHQQRALFHQQALQQQQHMLLQHQMIHQQLARTSATQLIHSQTSSESSLCLELQVPLSISAQNVPQPIQEAHETQKLHHSINPTQFTQQFSTTQPLIHDIIIPHQFNPNHKQTQAQHGTQLENESNRLSSNPAPSLDDDSIIELLDELSIDEDELYNENIHTTQDLINQFTDFYFSAQTNVSISSSSTSTVTSFTSLSPESAIQSDLLIDSDPNHITINTLDKQHLEPSWDPRFNNLLMVAFVANDRQPIGK